MTTTGEHHHTDPDARQLALKAIEAGFSRPLPAVPVTSAVVPATTTATAAAAVLPGRPVRPAFDDEGYLIRPELRGHQVVASHAKARRGWYAPLATPAPTTTRQAEVLNPAVIAAPTDDEGIIVGRDTLSSCVVAHDPFTAYAKGVVSSPNVIILGAVGAGKSSLIKTVYVLRPMILRGRRVAVIDKKNRGGEGEYAEATRQMGAEPLKMLLGQGGTCINPLDPVILHGDGASGQLRLLIAVAEQANGGLPLDKWEGAGLRYAHQRTLRRCEADGRDPVLADLVDNFGAFDPDQVADLSAGSRERLHQAAVGVKFLFEAVVSDELAGLFDGPTSPEVRLADRLTTFDVSQLPEDGPAVSMVMAVVNVWLLGTLRRDPGWQTNFVAEEGWHLLGGPGGRLFRSNSKLARALGLSNIAAIHHTGDIPTDSPAIAMVKEAQTAHLYRQDREDDIDACVGLFGLGDSSRATLANLRNGQHLLKIGAQAPVLVEHHRSSREKDLTDTDEAMLAGGTR